LALPLAAATAARLAPSSSSAPLAEPLCPDLPWPYFATPAILALLTGAPSKPVWAVCRAGRDAVDAGITRLELNELSNWGGGQGAAPWAGVPAERRRRRRLRQRAHKGRLVALGDDHLVRRAFLAGLDLAAEQALAGVELRQRCWAAQAQEVLRDLSVVAAGGVGLVATAPAAEAALQSAYATALAAADAVKAKFYREHVRGSITAATYRPQLYLKLRNREARCALAQPRMGTYWLHVDTGRRAQPFCEREQRTCHLCTGQVGDELHMLLVCPLYAPDRERAGDLLAGEQGRVADFVLACKRRLRVSQAARAAELAAAG
jgi:hypothetical protein